MIVNFGWVKTVEDWLNFWKIDSKASGKMAFLFGVFVHKKGGFLGQCFCKNGACFFLPIKNQLMVNCWFGARWFGILLGGSSHLVSG